MRYLLFGILIYIIYLFLKYLVRIYIRTSGKGGSAGIRTKKKKDSKIDLNKIEEAEYEEIKKPKEDQ